MDDRLLFLLSRAGYALKSYIRRELGKNEIHFSPVEMGILFCLKQSDGLPMNEIARVVQVDGAAITRYVDSLESNGYVKREASRDDRRKIIIRITSNGVQEATKCKSVVRRINASIKEGLSPEDIAGFVRVLNALLSKFDE
jgi:MarR family transcriptional regulator, organic hydroperoxide resistance regulator